MFFGEIEACRNFLHLPHPSVYCLLFRGSADDIVGIHPSSMAAAEKLYLIKVVQRRSPMHGTPASWKNGEVNIEQLLATETGTLYFTVP